MVAPSGVDGFVNVIETVAHRSAGGVARIGTEADVDKRVPRQPACSSDGCVAEWPTCVLEGRRNDRVSGQREAPRYRNSTLMSILQNAVAWMRA